ncbi:DUF2161 domain-containing phosphodiesterase [Aestuariispira insulae]|uniref:DUF2161 domain-containing phosphodiesterase n=1 Tax=Aestuariispira insulae TaxID=1461337 RepID=UPI001FE3015D|nr:DUF2161 family putative PD-(D/E)XK-type phosphodiesterase [Aestuariispira insulae]
MKAFLEAQGYAVKGEVGACDVMAVRDGEPPVVVELKLRFNLDVILQAVDRLNIADNVYIAVPKPKGPAWKKNRKRILKLCRMLGLGLIMVRADGAEAVLDPGPYQPRINPKKNGRLLKEFSERVGDPNQGGTTGVKRITAYRQDALRLIAILDQKGEMSPAGLKMETGVDRAAAILQANHYGWFERVRRGVYVLSPKGKEAQISYRSEIDLLIG